MDEYYFSATVDSDTTLCIAPLSEARVSLSVDEMEDAGGYYLYEVRGGAEPSEVQVIAHLMSPEAAFKLSRMLKLE